MVILWYDRDNKQYVPLEESVVDTVNNTVSCTTTHFSTYLVIDRKIWLDSWREQIEYRHLPGVIETAYNIGFVVDVSSSMNSERLGNAKTALNTFIDAMYECDDATLVSFNSTGNVVENFGTSKSNLKSAVSSLSASVGVSEQFDNDGVDFIVGNDYNVQLRKTPLLALEQMARDFYAAKNINDLIVISGYRTQEQQKELYDNDLAQTGLDYSELVAKAGYSEHQTGYSIDFSTSTTWDYDGQGDYAWIDENCWKYGYILRYAENKTELTKIKYEPWHYRYVGVPHAYYMYKNGICMEEYIERLKQYTYEGEHLTFTDDNGKNYELYYVPSDDGNETTYVPVPVSLKYEVSGNNIDGFIVTVYTDESTAPAEQSDSSSAESTPEA